MNHIQVEYIDELVASFLTGQGSIRVEMDWEPGSESEMGELLKKSYDYLMKRLGDNA